MIPLSATAALDPAFARARRLLTLRRSWRTALKLAFVTLVAEIGSGFNFNFNFGNHAQQHGHLPHILAIGFALGYAVVIAIVLAIGLALFYVGSRLQFVVFDLLLRQETLVAPSWRLFGPVTWRWVGIRLLVLIAAAALFSPLLVPMLLGLSHAAASNAAQMRPGAFLSLLFGYLGTILLVSFAMFLIFTIVRSFGLPVIVFENTGVGATFRRSFELFGADMGQSMLYVLLQVALRFVMLVGGYIAFFLIAMLSAIPPALVGVVLYFLTHGHGAAGKVAMVAGLVVLGALWFVWILVASIYVFGAAELFLCAYSIYFVAGRYPPLGAMLVAQEPQLAYPPGYGAISPAAMPPPAPPAGPSPAPPELPPTT